MRRSSITKSLLFAILAILVSVSGQAQTCAPGSGPTTTLHPGDNVQSIVNSNPCGSTFIFAPGVYANVTIFPLDETNHPIDGDTFAAQNVRTSTQPSILYGATVVSNFTHQGAYWVGTVTTTPAPASGRTGAAGPGHEGASMGGAQRARSGTPRLWHFGA